MSGRGELGAERRAEAPAEPAGRTEREERVRACRAAIGRGAQRIFVEDDRVVADGFADARADRYSGEIVVPGVRILRQLRAPRPHRALSGVRGAAAMRASAICSRDPTARVSAVSVLTVPAWIARSLGKLRIG